jgi:hypothetical protein
LDSKNQSITLVAPVKINQSTKVTFGFTNQIHEGVTVESKYVSSVEKNLREEIKLAAKNAYSTKKE